MANNERLSPEQAATVDAFVQSHQLARVRQVRDDSCCYRTAFIDWCLTTSTHSIFYQTQLELTPSGKVRQQRTEQLQVVEAVHAGQTILPLPTELILPAVPATKTNHALYSRKGKVRQPKRKKLVQQLSLPLFGAPARLHEISLAKGYPVQSQEELLSGKVEHYSLDQGKVFNLPQAIVELLQDAHATLDEWENAIQLLGVTGEQGVLRYVEEIEVFRKLNGQQQSVTVPVPVKQTNNQTQGVSNEQH